jgi:hypothetical protein
MTIEQKRQEILDILEYFKFDVMFTNSVFELKNKDGQEFKYCHISYVHGNNHGGYFSMVESEVIGNVYDFNLSGIRSDDFEKVKGAFWLYCKLVKEYCS